MRVVIAILLWIDGRFGTDLYYAQRLSRRVAPQVASGLARARVVLAGLLFGTLRWSRPIVLRLDAPHGRVRFILPDYAAFKVLDEMFYRREYDVALPEPPSTIVDLGGHVGVSCLFFRRRWPSSRIVTVEPNPALLPLLRHNVSQLDVETIHGAVADRPGTAHFIPAERSWGGMTREAEGGPGAIPALTLDSLLDQPVGLLKVDIEGAEFAALAAANRLRNARVIVGEIHGALDAAETQALVGSIEGSGFGVRCQGAKRNVLFTAIRRDGDVGPPA
jgi:FkbM family methyltransferase